MTTTRGAAQRFHLIGIGGAGMSVVAELLAARGWAVTGSDQADSATLQRLRNRGIGAYAGHDAAHVPEEATIVVSSAVKATNIELAPATARHQRVIHRSEALALAAVGWDFVAVAGAHGKTTTSGMLAAMFHAMGVDASFAVGGVVTGFDTGAHLGDAPIFVAEADESDASFLNYSPRVAVVTNIEPDHLDHYGTTEAFEDAFAAFATRIVDGGTLVVCVDDPGGLRLAQRLTQHHRNSGHSTLLWTYGTSTATDLDVNPATHAVIDDMRCEARTSHATVTIAGDTVTLDLSVSGNHNLLNATAALLAGTALGFNAEDCARALSVFRGTGRRFEWRGEVGRRRLFDDYAHHPTEVAAALRQARDAAGEGRVVVVFQPHLFSRTRNFADRFASSLALADEVVVCDIYAAREVDDHSVTSEIITDQLPGARWVPDRHDAARLAAQLTQPGDICVTMGAGNITDTASTILSEWESTA